MSAWTVNSDIEDSDEQVKKIVVGVLLPRHFPHPDDLAFFSRLDSVLPGVVLATQKHAGSAAWLDLRYPGGGHGLQLYNRSSTSSRNVLQTQVLHSMLITIS